MRQYVIIGSGVAGIAAIEAIREQERSALVTLICDETEGYYSRPGLAYFLTGEIPEEQLFPFVREDYERLVIKKMTGRAVQIDSRAHQVKLERGEALTFDRLLVATGSAAMRLNIPGIQAQGVLKLDNLGDAKRILALAHRGRTAVVIGGGITALEIVEGLVAKGVQTHLILRGDRYWGAVLDETESRLVEQHLQADGVKIAHRSEVIEILTNHQRVVGVQMLDGRQLKCDLVVVAVGVLPRKELAAVSGLETDRGIVVNEMQQSSVSDIYAAGDVAQVIDRSNNSSILQSLWGPARQQGMVAGYNMIGQSRSYHRPAAVNVTRLANITTTIIGVVGGGRDEELFGIARGESEAWRQVTDALPLEINADINHVRLLVGRSALVGAVVMGDQAISQPLEHLISNQVDITPIRTRLLEPHADIAMILADFWTDWREKSIGATQQP